MKERDIKSMLLKIKRLADGGFEGEKVAAEELLHKLMKRYGVSMSDLSDEERVEYSFSYKTSIDRRLIIQILASISSEDSIDLINLSATSHPPLYVYAKLTKTEYMLFQSIHSFHKRLWRKEKEKLLETAYLSYIHKHRIYPDHEGNYQTIDEEQIKSIMSMMSHLSDEKYHKQIQERNGKQAD